MAKAAARDILATGPLSIPCPVCGQRAGDAYAVLGLGFLVVKFGGAL